MKKYLVFLLAVFGSLGAVAQTTAVTATITDTDSIVWINASVTVDFVPNPNQPNINIYTINGVPITSTAGPNYAQYIQQTLASNGSGLISVTLLDNSRVSPAGSSWHFVVRPNANVQAISYNPIAVSGASYSLTTYLSTNSIAPRLPALPGSYAYADIEIQPIPNTGGSYFSTTADVVRIWNGTAWQNGSSTGGTIPATNNVLKGNGTAGVAVAATAGTDYVVPSGNVATATALASAPTGCGTGQAPTGSNFIDAQGNAHNCLPIGATASIPATTNLLEGTGTAGSSQAATPGADYLFPNGDNGLNAHGIASTGANQNSYDWFLTGDFCTDSSPSCSPAAIYYGEDIIVNTGLNPDSIKDHVCTSTSSIATAKCKEVFEYPVASSYNPPIGDKSTNLASGINVYNNMPQLVAQYFGAYGDAYQPADGMNTVAFNNTVVINDDPLTSTAIDGGKQVWISGAGAGGVAFNATIVTVVDTHTAVLSAAPQVTLNNVHGVFGHDDTVAVQACFQYSSTNGISCVLKTITPNTGIGLTGFLIGSAPLQLVSNNTIQQSGGVNVTGSTQVNATNLFCEYNGDCLELQVNSAIQGTNVTNLTFQEDPTQPNSRAIHLNPTNAPFTNANFTNITVNSPSQECLWLDGGGGPGYGYNEPNQYINFYQFYCAGANVTSHPANMIKMTGQAAQIIFLGGQVNALGYTSGSSPNYPNPLVSITEKTSGLGDTPVDVKFFGYTIEQGTQGLYVGNGANNIHFDNGYFENMSSPIIVVSAVENTFNGNHIANSGNTGGVFQFSSGGGGSVRDNYDYGGGVTVAAFAVCTGNSTIDFANNISSVATTTGCATTTGSTGGGSLTVTGSTASITATGSFSSIFSTGVMAGKTLTLYNAGSSFQLTTGGNISFGNYTAPLTIPANGSVVLTLMDTGVTWLITSGPTPSFSAPNWSTIVHGANTDTGAFSTIGPWTFGQTVFFSSSSGLVNTQFGPGNTPGTSYTNFYDDGNFHIDGTASGTNRALFFKGSLSGYIAAFQPPSGTNVATILLDGTYSTSGGVTAAAPVAAPIFDSNGTTPTFTPGTGVASLVCASGHTCTQSRGELTLTNTSATTGTLGTVTFASALAAVPECYVIQNGGSVMLALGHGTPTASAFTISAGITLLGVTTVTIDYGCQL